MHAEFNLKKGSVMQKIKRISHFLSLFFRSLCWAMPLATACLILFNMDFMLYIGAWSSMITETQVKEILDSGQFSLTHRLVILAIEFMSLSITVFICHKLANLFYLYEKGYLFEAENIKLIKHVGICMIVGQLVHLIYQPLITAALSFNNPVGSRFVTLSIGTTNATTLITAFVILVASWVVQEANQLKSETQLTI
jgi:hypothetical protein